MGLIDEINEQPAVADRLLRALPARIGPIVDAVRAQGCDHVLIAARGSSDNCAVYAQYAIGAVGRMPVALATPSLFSRYHQPPTLRRVLVIGISQSGRSPDVVSVLEEARGQGALSVAITNDGASPLAAVATHVLELDAGPERSIAATKTYTAQLITAATLAAALGSPSAPDREALQRLPDAMAAELAKPAEAALPAEEHRSMEDCVVLGRGYNLATALEWALKLKELALVRAQAYSSADYAHGPVASLSADARLLAVIARGPLADDIRSLVVRLADERHARVLTIAADPTRGAARLPFADDLPEWLSPITAILPAQLFTAALTRAKGLDPERPRGLNKVTLTR